MPALLKAAATALHRHENDIKSVRKLDEGGFNRVFEVTMKDGFQLIARLPYPSTQPKSLVTASEVATMNLVRHHGVPTPKIYQYSSNACNPVGAEYILMEKIQGRCLGDMWFDLSDKDRVRLLGEIVDQEAKLFNIDFPAYGSVYLDADLPGDVGRTPMDATKYTENFCIGPDVSLKHWFQTRSKLDVSRSSAKTPVEVLQNGARKELAWLRRYGKPRLPFERVYREMFGYQKVDPSSHVDTLEKYLQVCQHLVPSEDWLQKPVLRHPDLNPNNIFVTEECKIVSIIDWQHTTVLPLFLHAGIPASIQNYGDPDSEALIKPVAPPTIDEEDEEDRQKELELHRRRHAHFYYVGATATKLKVHFQAMMHEKGLFRKKIYQHAAEPWEGNSIPLKADIVQVVQEWSDIIKGENLGDQDVPSCPLSLDEREADDVMAKMSEQETIDGRIEILQEAIGISSDGWVPHERYDGAVQQAQAMKAQALGYAEDDHEREMTRQHWPFDDFDEDE